MSHSLPAPITAWLDRKATWSNGVTTGSPRITALFVSRVYETIRDESLAQQRNALLELAAGAFSPPLGKPPGLAFRPLDKSLQLLRKARLIAYDWGNFWVAQ